MNDDGQPDELTPEERAWLDGPGDQRGYQPTSTGGPPVPPAPPPGRASASPKPETEAGATTPTAPAGDE